MLHSQETPGAKQPDIGIRLTNRFAAFVVANPSLAWALTLFICLATALSIGNLQQKRQENERLTRLNIEAERRGVDIMAQTLNGNLMGSVFLLGLIDGDIKRELQGGGTPNGPWISGILENVGRSHDTDGLFIIGNDGIVKSSWNRDSKPSTGLDVKFRPYFQMALKGNQNIYAAFSLARGDRSLYFAAPVFPTYAKSPETIGVVVARTDVSRIDKLLKGKEDIALLLSPQGIVFAGNRPEWIGRLAGESTPEHLKAIRELKQFGNLFDDKEPLPLPISIQRGFQTIDKQRYAVSSSPVQWNDPLGNWHLVLMEDVSRTVPLELRLRSGLGAGLIVFLLAMLMIKLLRGHHTQTVSAQKLTIYARTQEISVERKSQLAAAALRFQQAENTGELASSFLAEAHQMLGSLQGVVYVATQISSEPMRLMASYACGEGLPSTLTLGEGLLGECAISRQPRLIEMTEGQWSIRSGLGECRPAAVLMAPVLLHENLLGVVEIALLEIPDDDRKEQFAEMISLLAMNLEILRRNVRTEEMRAETMACENNAACTVEATK